MMSIHPEISIIVPIYNQENYLNRSLSSIEQQKFKGFEVILIDDGSNDNSALICNKYVSRLSNFKYFKKENGGVASARQLGLDLASGRFVIQVDPDDWIEPNFLSELYNAAIDTNSDMIVCDYYEEYSDTTKLKTHENVSTLLVKDFKEGIADGSIWGVCWNKLIRREPIKHIKFEKGINFQEDRLYIYRVLSYIQKISFVHKALYHYNRSNPNSILSSKINDYSMQYWKIKRKFIDSANKKEKWLLKKKIVKLPIVLQFSFEESLNVKNYQRLIKPFKWAIRYNCIFQRGHSLKRRILCLFATTPILQLIYIKIKNNWGTE